MLDLTTVLSPQNIQNPEKIVKQLIAEKNWKVAEEALTSMANDESRTLNSKEFFKALLPLFKNHEEKVITANALKSLSQNLVDKLSTKNYLEMEIYIVKQRLAKIHQEQDQLESAVEVLKSINFESPQLSAISIKEKITNYLDIVENIYNLTLQTESDIGSADAEIWMQKLKGINHEDFDKEQRQQFELLKAQQLDFSRKFLKAAYAYYQLSTDQDQDEIALAGLTFAVRCAILTPAGPERNRILQMLYKDQRVQHVGSFNLLQKMFNQRIINNEEKLEFEKTLFSHQKTQISYDFTVLDKAVIEHNTIAVSKVYESIKIKALGKILQINEVKCEEIVQDMISQQRIKAQMDQLTGYIRFLQEDDIPENFNDNIKQFCGKLNEYLEKLNN